ncbi:hypothetical protein [Mesorhizobium caraganae]|uniref:hypothetical protein n=1 Tax=Mesorhizobium caraganae TaxID=483206 RepID=UPI003ECCBB29
MATMLRSDTPAKCCSYCGSRDHDYEDCPKRKADAERQREDPASPDRDKDRTGNSARQSEPFRR